MKRVVKDAVSKASNYLRHDFKEIVNPSAMPNPEWYKVKESAGKTSLWEFVKIFGLAFREYSIGWKHFVLGTTREKEKEGGGETKEGGGKGDDAMKGSSSTEDMSHIASELGQKGAESARPYLQRLYKTRMSAYRDAIQEFSIGFGEGLAAKDSDTKDTPLEEKNKRES